MVNEFPFTRLIKGAVISDVYFNFVNESQSGVVETKSGLGHNYDITLELTRMSLQESKEFMGWLSSLRGRLNAFNLTIPDISYTTSSYTGSITVKGAGQAGNQIAVDGLPVSTRRILKRGDYVKFETSSKKVYRLVEDLDSDGAGEGILYLNSVMLLSTPNDNERVVYNNVDFRLRLVSDQQSFSLDVIKRGDFVLNTREAYNL